MGRSRNWPDLRSQISKIRNIQIVDTYVLTIHCEFQRVRITGVRLARCQTLKKRNLRSGHLMWAGGVTFGVIGLPFFGNVSNCWLNSNGKFGGATRRRFFAICEKSKGGLISGRVYCIYIFSPAVRGLKTRNARSQLEPAELPSRGPHANVRVVVVAVIGTLL